MTGAECVRQWESEQLAGISANCALVLSASILLLISVQSILPRRARAVVRWLLFGIALVNAIAGTLFNATHYARWFEDEVLIPASDDKTWRTTLGVEKATTPYVHAAYGAIEAAMWTQDLDLMRQIIIYLTLLATLRTALASAKDVLPRRLLLRAAACVWLAIFVGADVAYFTMLAILPMPSVQSTAEATTAQDNPAHHAIKLLASPAAQLFVLSGFAAYTLPRTFSVYSSWFAQPPSLALPHGVCWLETNLTAALTFAPIMTQIVTTIIVMFFFVMIEADQWIDGKDHDEAAHTKSLPRCRLPTILLMTIAAVVHFHHVATGWSICLLLAEWQRVQPSKEIAKEYDVTNDTASIPPNAWLRTTAHLLLSLLLALPSAEILATIFGANDAAKELIQAVASAVGIIAFACTVARDNSSSRCSLIARLFGMLLFGALFITLLFGAPLLVLLRVSLPPPRGPYSSCIAFNDHFLPIPLNLRMPVTLINQHPSIEPAPIPEVMRVRTVFPCSAHSTKQHQTQFEPYKSPSLVRALASLCFVPSFVLGHLSRSPIKYAKRADATSALPLSLRSSGSFPLSIFSHGLGGTPETYWHLALEIAAHGSVVILPAFCDGTAGIAHVQANRTMGYQFGHWEPHFLLDEQRESSRWRAVLKHRTHLSRLLVEEVMTCSDNSFSSSPWCQYIDRSRTNLHLIGHSFGGMSSIELAASMEAGSSNSNTTEPARTLPIASVTALDPWLYPLLPTTVCLGLRIPLLLIASESFLHRDTAEVAALHRSDLIQLATATDSHPSTKLLWLPHTLHVAFTDAPFWMPKWAAEIAGLIDPRQDRDVVAARIVQLALTHIERTRGSNQPIDHSVDLDPSICRVPHTHQSVLGVDSICDTVSFDVFFSNATDAITIEHCNPNRTG
jgi:hypothetical protein